LGARQNHPGARPRAYAAAGQLGPKRKEATRGTRRASTVSVREDGQVQVADSREAAIGEFFLERLHGHALLDKAGAGIAKLSAHFQISKLGAFGLSDTRFIEPIQAQTP